MEFYNIIDKGNYKVFLPEKCHFSIGTSPYYAHQNALAIDIYQDLFLENFEAVSPVSGKIIKTKELIAPPPKFRNGINKDYIILIENQADPEIVYKILHVCPKIKEGEKIDVGDILGTTIRNGYFAYWSTPHIHLEIRAKEDAIRARGGKNFSLSILRKNDQADLPRSPLNAIPLAIENVCAEYILARLPKELYLKLDRIYGIKGRINNLFCIIDGGIPMYKNGTLLSDQIGNFKANMQIYWETFNIGFLNEIRGDFGLYHFNPLNILINDQRIRGISLFLANFEPLLKIIPFKSSQFEFKRKSQVSLTIQNVDSLIKH